MAKKRKATCMDVAKMAGVSQSTVSMILNNYKNTSFSSDTKQRVLDACVALKYKSNMSLSATEKADNVLLVICPSYENLHYIQLIEAMQERARELGYLLMAFCTFRDVSEETDMLRMAKNLSVAGVLFLCPPENLIALQQFRAHKPVMLIYDKNPNIDMDTIELDNFKIGSIIAEHLLDLGHRHVAFVTLPLNPNQIVRIRRLEGLRRTFAENGLNPAEYVSVCTAESEGLKVPDTIPEYEFGYLMASKVIELHKEVTALVGMNDMVALGMMDALLEQKKRIPYDYSICGCDNIMPARLKGISLTTVEQFNTQKGKEAVDILVNKIKGYDYISPSNNPASCIRVEYAPNLIVRSSTGVNRRNSK